MKKWILGLSLMAFLPPSVSAQEALQQQVDQLREDVTFLQRQLYREHQDGIDLVSAQDMAIRVNNFDEDLRKAVGKVDELEFKIKQINERIDTLNKDFDVRFRMIEGKPLDGIGKGVNAAPAPSFDAPVANGAPASIVGGAISKGDDLPKVNTRSAEDLYKQAMEAINEGRNEDAAQGFTSLMTKYPEHRLAANAQYWLGEAYYAQKDFAKAAVAFGKGLEKYKDGNKGADSLLKLGMSMRELGKKEEACTAFKSLPTEFPKAEAGVKSKAAEFAKKLGCE